MLLGKQGEIVNLSATDVYFSGSEYEKKTIFIVNFYTFCFSGWIFLIDITMKLPYSITYIKTNIIYIIII